LGCCVKVIHIRLACKKYHIFLLSLLMLRLTFCGGVELSFASSSASLSSSFIFLTSLFISLLYAFRLTLLLCWSEKMCWR
jgi:hypothetical protein